MRYKVLILVFFITNLFSQEKKEISKNNGIALLFGLNQPIVVDGFNLEVNLFYGQFVFDYSHGISLDLSNDLLVDEAKEQKLVAHLPYSTGFGIGYRINHWLNVRLEPKWHNFEMYYSDKVQTSKNQIAEYTSFTLGVGAYLEWKPFEEKNGFLKGIIIAPSIRYWPKVSTTLNDNKITYFNEVTNKTETHKALEIGIANTPFILNVSVGYSYTF